MGKLSRCIRYMLVLLLAMTVFSFATACFFDDDSDSEEVRIYLEEDGSGVFTGLYVVKSPQGLYGNWGPNLISSYQILQSYGWKMYKFEPGTYDIMLLHNASSTTSPYKDYTKKAENRQGVKYSNNGTLIFTTTFTF